jgi:DNA-directed RNA polymerase II subunit RPB3
MQPELIIREYNDYDTFHFTLSNVDVSIANSIRRTILSEIPTFVLNTGPQHIVIHKNTTRLTNEIIKQRLNCIPVHITDIDTFPYQNYIVELNVENNGNTILDVTTKDFVVKPLDDNNDMKNIDVFPANDYTGDHILFLRLRPNISKELEGDKLHFTCKLDIKTAKQDGCFNVVSTCSYGNTIDDTLQHHTLNTKIKEWEKEGKTADEITIEKKNWLLLDGKRCYKKNSFDFIIETIGVYTNKEIVNKASHIIIAKLKTLIQSLNEDSMDIKIRSSDKTIENCYDIILVNHDYTIGKVFEHFIYDKYYNTKLTFCGFRKTHPHNTDCIITIAYKENTEMINMKTDIIECLEDAINIYNKLILLINETKKTSR